MSDEQVIGIEQDYEIEDDGEVGGPLAVFWTVGHGHDPYDVIRAVVEHCLDEGRDIPRIDGDRAPVEMWQTVVKRGDCVEYRRAASKDQLPPYTRAADIAPITLLDLDARARGAAKCSIRDCRNPWKSGVPVQVATKPDPPDGSMPRREHVEVWLCRDHQDVMADKYYRMAVVPVGAVIELEPDKGVAS